VFRRVALTLLAVVVFGACGGDDDDDAAEAPDSTSTTTSTSTTVAEGEVGWDPAALTTAEELAQQIKDGGVACDDFAADDYELLASDFEDRLPLPLVSAACVGPGGEDFTFEVFEGPDARETFIASKLQLICTTANEEEINFPGLPIVTGSDWIIEPDEEGTADALAAIVGGEAALHTCSE